MRHLFRGMGRGGGRGAGLLLLSTQAEAKDFDQRVRMMFLICVTAGGAEATGREGEVRGHPPGGGVHLPL